MKNKRHLFTISIWAQFCIVLFLGDALAVNNPVGPPTVPPSSYTYQPAYGNYTLAPGAYSNLIVTGNITGGKHFRGIVPYRSVSEFTAPLGSSSLNSFLRSSAESYHYSDRAPGSAWPYYSPSQTVTTINRDGQSGLEMPRIRVNKGTGEFLPPLQKTQEMQQARTEFPIDEEMVYRKFRPVSVLPEELEQLLSKYELLEEAQESEPVLEDKQLAELRQGLAEAKKKAQEIDRKIEDMFPGSESLKPAEPEDYTIKPPQPPQPFETPAEKQEPLDVYQQMLQQVQEDFQEYLEQAEQRKKQRGKEDEKTEQPGQPAPLVPPTEPASGTDYTRPGSITEAPSERARLGPPTDRKLPKFRTPSAKAMLGLRKSFATDKNDRFNQYLKAAQDYMKQGKYYRAADAYTLASIYEPKNPLPLAGKAHALLAAGEYLSSALYLSKAIEIFPGYVRFQIDIIEMIGDKDTLESRVVNIKQWQKLTGSPELQFLLAYVFYNTGKLPWAKQAIDAAFEKMPDSRAVKTLNRAIDNAMATSGLGRSRMQVPQPPQQSK